MLERHLADSDEGVVVRYLDQCSQRHITILNAKNSLELFQLMGKEEVTIKLSSLEDISVEISCKIVAENYQCSIQAPILNFGEMSIGLGDYNPNYWMAKFHSQFFLRDGKYQFSPKQEYIVAKNRGVENFISAFNQQVFNFDVLDNQGNSTVSISCEDVVGDHDAIICRIIF